MKQYFILAQKRIPKKKKNGQYFTAISLKIVYGAEFFFLNDRNSQGLRDVFINKHPISTCLQRKMLRGGSILIMFCDPPPHITWVELSPTNNLICFFFFAHSMNINKRDGIF